MSFKAQAVSRHAGSGKTRSAVSMAAYRAGDKLHDERYQQVKDFSHKRGIYASEIITPVQAPAWATNRQQLWNKAEAIEKRYDSRVCREFIISLPHEMSHDHKKEIIHDFVGENFTNKGLVADIAYHDFTGRHSHNPHCHIMITTRPLDGEQFSKHKDRSLDQKDALKQWRKSYMDITNKVLEREGYTVRITTESLETRGITDRAPVSESMAVNQMRKKHEQNPQKYPKPEVAKQNDELQRLNQKLATLKQELAQAEKHDEQEHKRQESIQRINASAARTAKAVTELQKPANQNKPAAPQEDLTEEEREVLRKLYQQRNTPNP